MAKKKKRKTSPAMYLTGVLVLVLLTIFGIQAPDALQEFLGLDQTPTSSETAPPPTASGENPGPIELGKADFSKNELATAKKGWIDYHELDQLGRATGADALLTPDMINTGTSANSSIKPPGFVSGLDPYNHSRGHLIGRQLGGTGDDARNLTTLYQTPVNTPYMTKYENMVRQALEHGETVRYRVTPIYTGDELMCTKVDMEAKSLTGSLDFHIEILNEK